MIHIFFRCNTAACCHSYYGTLSNHRWIHDESMSIRCHYWNGYTIKQFDHRCISLPSWCNIDWRRASHENRKSSQTLCIRTNISIDFSFPRTACDTIGTKSNKDGSCRHSTLDMWSLTFQAALSPKSLAENGRCLWPYSLCPFVIL